jgi:hypothetical protein
MISLNLYLKYDLFSSRYDIQQNQEDQKEDFQQKKNIRTKQYKITDRTLQAFGYFICMP